MVKTVHNFNATRDQIYAWLNGFDSYTTWFPGCKKCIILSSSGNRTETEMVLEGLKTLTMGLRFDGDPGNSLRFEMFKGSDLKAYSGEYRLTDAPDGKGTVMTSEVNMDAGSMVPKFMADRMMRKSLEDLGKALEVKVKSAPATPAAAAPAPAASAPAATAAPAAGAKPRKRARRILQVTRTASGTRIWYMGRYFEPADKA